MSRTIFLAAVLALIFAVSVQAAGSSSSTGVPSLSSSSSSVFPTSSTGSTGSPDAYPSNSLAVTFNVVFSVAITAANYVTEAANIKLDIAYNLANGTSLNQTTLAPFIVVTQLGGYTLAPSSRRLLQSSTGVSYVVLGNITNVYSTFSVTNVVNNFINAAGNGTLAAPNSGATIPVQTITAPKTVGSTPVSSSSGVGANGASSIVSSPVAVLFAAVASMALLL